MQSKCSVEFLTSSPASLVFQVVAASSVTAVESELHRPKRGTSSEEIRSMIFTLLVGSCLSY
jgi:hypothetical protein